MQSLCENLERGVVLAMNKKGIRSWMKVAFCGIALSAATALTGCQMSIGDQTLPSAYYLKDDVQYFPKGPEFKLWREAEALKQARSQDN